MTDVVNIHRPAFALRVGGETAPQPVLGSLTRWSVLQRLSRPSRCILSLVDPDETCTGMLRLGTDVALSQDDGTPLFAGTVASIRREKRADGTWLCTLTAYDALDSLRRAQTIESRQAGPLRNVLQAVVADSGLDVRGDDTGIELPLMIQWGCNDLDWIERLCATYGLYFYLRDGSLHLISLDGDSESTVELEIDMNLFEAGFENNVVNLRTEATASAWNPLTTDSFSATAMDFTLEAAADWQGVNSALTEVARDIVGGSGAQDEGALSRVAQADLDRSVRRANCISALADGDANLSPGRRVSVRMFGEHTGEEYVLTHVEHAYARESGYTTSISSMPPADPQRMSGPPLSLGVVADTDDPAGFGRVRVQLKAFNDLESDWLNVCNIGAGSNKGLIVQPEEGDKVIVAFVNDNPAQGIVLGGLYGSSDTHDRDVSVNRPRPYTLATSDGQSLRLDDQQGSARLHSRGGSLDLHPDHVVLETTTDLRIAAPGKRIRIVADKIDFERG